MPAPDVNVLSVVHSAAFGGPHNQAIRLHEELAGEGLRLTVVLPDEEGDAPARLRAAGVKVVQMPLLRPRASRREQGVLALLAGYPGQVRRLRELVRSEDIDVVEVHGLMNLDGALAARWAGRGVVWQLIDTRPPRSLRWLLMPLVLLLADVTMTTGEGVADEYPGIRLRPDRWIPFVPPVRAVASPAGRVTEVAGQVRTALGVPDRAVVVSSVGNLNPQKGFEALIDAVADCRAEPGMPEVELRIRGAVQSGHESYADGLRRRAADAGLTPGTVGTFEPGIGPRELLGASDVFALASRARSEGLATVVLEAMSSGVAVVVTRVGSMAEVVEDGVSGAVVDPDAPDQLRRAIGALVRDPARRRRLGARGREVVDRVAAPRTFALVQLRAYRTAAVRRRRTAGPVGRD
jgi:glycosyltransferase involved in cell wall biosynthesis